LNTYFHGYHLVRELTVNLDGVFWHPLATEPDMQVTKRIFPLAQAVARVPLMTFS
jgi:hypothetical protein